jgi:hypothetical protein
MHIDAQPVDLKLATPFRIACTVVGVQDKQVEQLSKLNLLMGR